MRRCAVDEFILGDAHYREGDRVELNASMSDLLLRTLFGGLLEERPDQAVTEIHGMPGDT